MTLKEQNNEQPPLYGLVLAGGKSRRMGHDKSVIKWHGKEQRYFIADLLTELCKNVFISCRDEQVAEIGNDYKTLPDTYADAGPLAGILSAFKAFPDAAWLVVACDLPLLDKDTLEYLMQHRDTSKIATTYQSPHDGLPEPLITIWEPASLPALLSYLTDGFTCPRKALIRNIEQVKILIPPGPHALMNANTPEDAEAVIKLIG